MQLRRLTMLPAILLFLSFSAISYAQKYKSIVVFGDSLSDTGNDTNVSIKTLGLAFPGPFIFDYTLGRFTDGPDTAPAATKYKGVWVEQLAAMLPSRPLIADSLDGGTDYAYGFAFTGPGTTYFGIFGPYAITVNNVDQQITDYLKTHSRIDDETLFVVWAGANDVLNATTPTQIVQAGINQAASVERLIDAGATQFIVANLPPLGAIPRVNVLGPAAIAAETGASVLFNDTLAQGLDLVHNANPGKHIRIYPFDVFSLVNKIIASPSTYHLTNVTGSSQGAPVDPDTYLFWDGLHPTTHGHYAVAVAAAELIEHHKCLPDPDKGHDEGTAADWACVAPGRGGDKDN